MSLIDHVFLPRRLSTDDLHANINSAHLHRTEKFLLTDMCKTIKGLQQHIPPVVKNLFDKFEQLHSDGEIDPNQFSTQIRELQPNEMMGVYVREANCSMLLMMSPSSNEVTIAPFQVNLSNEQIYGDNINGDIQVKHTKLIK